MITAKQAYEIAKEWMGPFALVSAGYETESHFIFLREHNRKALDRSCFLLDRQDKRRIKNRVGYPGDKRI